ncbi:thioredoxin domain-containing protein [Candidatus Woesearchaeota archaeon]|nr:thioredoxin domain-containing protein [Candidatus Woesearchaeota archaeon]
MDKDKINWLGWNRDSFEKSRSENKPILLNLTAVWCHWCHVIKVTTYSDDEVAAVINREFVPIKVCIDQRPDIRDRYNMGGFPSTVFLDSDGNIIAGETYVPPGRMKAMLNTIRSLYDKKDFKVNKPEQVQEEKPSVELNEGMAREILVSIEDNQDSYYGGFGLQPKFPHPDVIDFLFSYYNRTKQKKYLDMALKALDWMHGGIYDLIEGGFFRYSVTQDWKTPHYEKMLDTNAGLLRNCISAFSITNNEKYKKIAEGIIEYVNKNLKNEDGGFYGSQDADEEYYQQNEEKRNTMKKPLVEKTIYTDWSSMMISSYILAYKATGKKELLDFALKSIEFQIGNLYQKERGMFHYFDGKLNENGLLSDNIYFMNALLDAFEAAQNEKYLRLAEELSNFITKNFHDSGNEGFFDRMPRADDAGMLKIRIRNFLENSFAASVFLRLHGITKKEEYRNVAESALLHFGNSFQKYGYFAASYASALSLMPDIGK